MAEERKHGLIIGAAPWRGGDFLKPYLERQSWMVFCADGGYANAKSAGLTPDFLIGDWDSGQAAMDEALALGITDLLLCGCTGGRLDHTISNLLLLEWLDCRGGRGMIIDEDNEVRLLTPGTFRLEDVPHYHYVSLVPLDSVVSGVTLKGMKYPLADANLTRGDTLSISNEPREPVMEIQIARGRALLIRSQREN